jgi:spermidine/putrescine transport system substrate-binding protein
LRKAISSTVGNASIVLVPSKECMMIRTIWLGLVFMFVSQPLLALELVIYNWPYYLAPEVKSLFTQETGITIKELYYDSDEARNRLLLSEHPPVLDIAIVDYFTLKNNSWASLFVTKPDGGYNNESHIDSRYKAACGQHAVPYFWGSVGIAYRASKVKQPITGWRDLLTPAPELNGHIVMIDDAMDLVSIALKTLGYSINTDTKSELEQAFKLLKAQKPQVLAYALSLAAIQDPALSAEVFATVTYSGDFYTLQSMSEFQDWRYVAPIEGSPLWIDCLAISKTSPHPAEAAQLVDFLMRPDVARLNGERLGFTPTLHDSEISNKIKQDSVAYPTGKHLQASEYYTDKISNDRIRNAIYFSVLK